MISPSPKLCEIFRNTVSCYGVQLLANRPTNKLEDTPCRIPLLLTLYINRYLPYLDAISSTATEVWATPCCQESIYFGWRYTNSIIIIINIM